MSKMNDSSKWWCIWLCLGAIGFFIGSVITPHAGVHAPEVPTFTYGQAVRVVGGFYVGREGKVAAYLQYPPRYLVTDITPRINLDREWIPEEYLAPVHVAEK
jgi:hypothetical protein